jgi:Type IIB DNA topoisomerase
MMSSSSSGSNKNRKRSNASASLDSLDAVTTTISTTGTKNRKRAPVQLANDVNTVLAKCRALKETLRAKKAKQDDIVVPNESDDDDINITVCSDSGETKPAGSGIPDGIVEVDELSATEVLEGIEEIALHITQQVLQKKGFSMEIPSRAASNQLYVKQWDRIVLGDKRTGRTFLNVRESRKSAITLRVMQLLHAVLTKRIHITKRDLFYTDVKQ